MSLDSTRVVLVMGVSGCGKTSVGQAVCRCIPGCEFLDADAFHPESNKAKMRSGVPLQDSDRWAWLECIKQTLDRRTSHIVLACSALKQAYRDVLAQSDPEMKIVFLNGSFDTIQSHISSRKDHFMPVSLLQSQFDALEIPSQALKVDIERGGPNELGRWIASQLSVGDTWVLNA